MNIAIVDDMAVERDALAGLLRRYAAERRLELTLDLFPGGEELLAGFQPYRYTAIFLDVFMNGMTGVQTARELRKSDGHTLLVFLTSSDAHMPDAFGVHAFDYIRKPASPARIDRVMDDILRLGQLDETREDALVFSSDRTECRLPYGDIVSVCAEDHYLQIDDSSGNSYRARMTFSAAADELGKDSRFLLINRGVLVNMDHIRSFRDGLCRLSAGEPLPVNVRNRKKIEQAWQNYVFAKIRAVALKGGGPV